MAQFVKVRRQGRMVWLDKKTGQTFVKKPTTSTSTPKPKPTPKPTTPTKPQVASVKDNIKFLRDAAARQQAAGMAPQTTPGMTGAFTALSIGASLGEAYRQTDRARAVSNRGAGRATFNQGPTKRNYPVQIGKAEDSPTPEEKAEVKAEVEAAEGSKADSGFVEDKPSTPTRDKVAKNRPMNTAETKAAGKDPMHVWALHNKQMILRNNNQRQKDILAEAEAAQNKTKLKTSAEKVGWQGRTGMY